MTLLDTLVDKYGCECTKKDIQKMELIIMQKLEYQLTRPTIQDFIKTVSTTHTDNKVSTTHTHNILQILKDAKFEVY